MRGGSGSYSDASSYGMYVNGPGGEQFSRTLDQTGAYGQIPGNVIIGAQGQNVVSASRMPGNSSVQMAQSGGRRHHRSHARKSHHRSKSKRGGFLGEIISQAVVPFGLLGMQQTFRRKHKHHNKSHKRTHRRR